MLGVGRFQYASAQKGRPNANDYRSHSPKKFFENDYRSQKFLRMRIIIKCECVSLSQNNDNYSHTTEKFFENAYHYHKTMIIILTRSKKYLIAVIGAFFRQKKTPSR